MSAWARAIDIFRRVAAPVPVRYFCRKCEQDLPARAFGDRLDTGNRRTICKPCATEASRISRARRKAQSKKAEARVPAGTLCATCARAPATGWVVVKNARRYLCEPCREKKNTPSFARTKGRA